MTSEIFIDWLHKLDKKMKKINCNDSWQLSCSSTCSRSSID